MNKLVFTMLMLEAGRVYSQTPELQVINRAAEALGGKDRVLSVKTLTIYGYGQQARVLLPKETSSTRAGTSCGGVILIPTA